VKEAVGRTMKRVFDQAFEHDVYEQLTIPTGEFVALTMAALMLLGLFFSSSTLPEVAKTVVADIAATLSHASRNLEGSLEARASERQVSSIEELATTGTRHRTAANGHHYRLGGHHRHACSFCTAAVNVKYPLKNRH